MLLCEKTKSWFSLSSLYKFWQGEVQRGKKKILLEYSRPIMNQSWVRLEEGSQQGFSWEVLFEGESWKAKFGLKWIMYLLSTLNSYKFTKIRMETREFYLEFKGNKHIFPTCLGLQIPQLLSREHRSSPGLGHFPGNSNTHSHSLLHNSGVPLEKAVLSLSPPT